MSNGAKMTKFESSELRQPFVHLHFPRKLS